MPLKYKHKLLIVDDEISVINAIKRILRSEDYEIHTALDGHAGLKFLKNGEGQFSLILSDQKMPGMTGSEFLTKAKGISPDTRRILLTGYSDINTIIDSINKSEIHRYFTKPWDNGDLITQIRQMLEQYELIIENRRLQDLTIKQNEELSELNNNLEKKVEERSKEIIQKNKLLIRLNEELESSLNNTVRAFSSLSEINMPELLTGHARRVSQVARQISIDLELSEAEIIQIEMATLLHDIGKIGFSKKILEYKDDIWTTEERRLYRKHAEQGQLTIQFINRMEHVSILVRCHHENFDGTGFPNKLSGEEIPLGSRIIAIANTYDKILNLQINIDDCIKNFAQKNKIPYRQLLIDEILLKKIAIEHILENSFIKYDPDIVKIFMDSIFAKENKAKKSMDKIEGIKDSQTLISSENNKNGFKVSIDNLKPGMKIINSLYSSSGRFLIAHDTVISDGTLQKLQAYNINDPITESIDVIIP